MFSPLIVAILVYLILAYGLRYVGSENASSGPLGENSANMCAVANSVGLEIRDSRCQ